MQDINTLEVIKSIAVKYGREESAVASKFEEIYKEVISNPRNANKLEELKLNRTIKRTCMFFEKTPTRVTEEKLYFCLGIDNVKDWNAKAIAKTIENFRKSLELHQEMVEQGDIMTEEITDPKTGDVVFIPQVDGQGDCIPRDNREGSFNIGKPLRDNWAADFALIPITDDAELPEIVTLRMYSPLCNPEHEKTVIDYDLAWKSLRMNVYFTKTGNLNIDDDVPPVVIKESEERIMSIINAIVTAESTETNRTDLADLRGFIIKNGRLWNDTTYLNIPGITKGYVTGVAKGKGVQKDGTPKSDSILVSDIGLPVDLKKGSGIKLWLPKNMPIDVIPNDEILFSFKGSVKATKYENRSNTSVGVGKGDVSLSPLGITLIWTDRPAEKPKEIGSLTIANI